MVVVIVEKNRVKYLMIVPNNNAQRLLTDDGHDFMTLVGKAGYTLVASEPKYGDQIVQQYAINPTYHYLFEL